jgi:hypothetical protein
MARKPRDLDAELQALMARAKKLKTQKTTQLGELVQLTGADTLPIDALAGLLLAAVAQSRTDAALIARWTERGAAFFRDGGKRAKPNGAHAAASAGAAAVGPAADAPATAAPDGGAV